MTIELVIETGTIKAAGLPRGCTLRVLDFDAPIEREAVGPLTKIDTEGRAYDEHVYNAPPEIERSIELARVALPKDAAY